MKQIGKYFLVFAVVLCCLIGLAAQAQTAEAAVAAQKSNSLTLSEGDKMFDFTVTDYKGNEITLSQVLKEKKGVMLNFWFSTCSPCAEEFPVIEQAYQLYKNDIEIIALNPIDNSNEIIAEYAARKGLSFPMAACPFEWCQQYGITAFPTSIFIDRDGIIRKIRIGCVTDPQFFTGIFDDLTSSELLITKQPQNAYATNGEIVKVSVAARGDGLTYQWYIKSAKANTYSLSSVKTATYSCRMSNSSKDRYLKCKITDQYGNSVWSNTVQLRMNGSISLHPIDCIAKAGTTAKFTIKATGSGLSYQWQYRTSSSGSWKNAKATGNTTATLSVPATASRHSYQYRCRIKDFTGKTIYSDWANLSVLGFKAQPVSKTAVAGKTIKLTAPATGNGLTYQWQYRTSSKGSWKNATALGNETETLAVPATVGRHGYQYRCKISDYMGNTLYSKTVSIYVLGIKTQPANKTVKVGAAVKFTVKATGKGLTYQWQYKTDDGSWKNVSASSGKTANYSLTAAARHNGYQYRCKIKDSAGNVLYTKTVKLTVNK